MNMIGGNAENITFAGLAEHRLDLSGPYHAGFCRNQEKGHLRGAARASRPRNLGLRCKTHSVWHMGRRHAFADRPSTLSADKASGDEQVVARTQQASSQSGNSSSAILPAEPVYWRATPRDALPCFKKPVSSMTTTASLSASVSRA